MGISFSDEAGNEIEILSVFGCNTEGQRTLVVNFDPDADGIVRRVPLLVEFDGQAVYKFAIRVLEDVARAGDVDAL